MKEVFQRALRIAACPIVAGALGAFAAEIDLAGTWRLERADDKSVACEIAVPGGVHSALLTQWGQVRRAKLG